MRTETADMAAACARAAAVLAALLVAPSATLMIGVGDWIVLTSSHWRFSGNRRFGVMLALNVVEYIVSGLFCPACAVLPVAVAMGVVVSSAFFLTGPERRPDMAVRSDGKRDDYIDVEVIDAKSLSDCNRAHSRGVKTIR